MTNRQVLAMTDRWRTKTADRPFFREKLSEMNDRLRIINLYTRTTAMKQIVTFMCFRHEHKFGSINSVLNTL